MIYIVLLMFTTSHSELELNIGNENCLAGNIAQTYDFCIPLNFLDTKDLKKTYKAKENFEFQIQSPKPQLSKFDNFFS